MTSKSAPHRRIGVWAEWPPNLPWANEGMVRLLGFLVEGAAAAGAFSFYVVVPHHLAAEARRDFAELKAIEGRDYQICAPESPPEQNCSDGDLMEDLVDFANTSVSVDGWLILFPHFGYSVRLNGPKAVIFPDSIPRIFPHFAEDTWGQGGYHHALIEKVRSVLSESDRVVVFSRHVALKQARDLFNVPENKIAIVPHSLPNLADDGFGDRYAAPTRASRTVAADLLRAHAHAAGLKYLANFPFEDVPFLVVSTQDRANKNISVVARALELCLRGHDRDLKLITTAPIHFGADWTPFPGIISERQLQNDILSMHALPRDVHAALYHCSLMAVHPSFFEGGRAPFPFSEAVSVGAPCLMAAGPHTHELLELAPELLPYVFDPYDHTTLAQLILLTADRRNEVLAEQVVVCRRLAEHRTWSDVSSEYVAAVPH